MLATLYASLGSEHVSERAADLRAQFWLRLLRDRFPIEIERGAELWAVGHDERPGENRAMVPRPAELIRMADIARKAILADIDTIDAVLGAEVA